VRDRVILIKMYRHQKEVWSRIRCSVRLYDFYSKIMRTFREKFVYMMQLKFEADSFVGVRHCVEIEIFTNSFRHLIIIIIIKHGFVS
jgi:hypothetical protein